MSKNKKPGKPRPRTHHDGEGVSQDAIKAIVWGVHLELSKERFNDYEFLEAVKKGDEGQDPLALVTLVEAIAGSPEKLKEIKQAVKRVKGNLQADSMAEFVNAFFTRLQKLAPNA